MFQRESRRGEENSRVSKRYRKRKKVKKSIVGWNENRWQYQRRKYLKRRGNKLNLGLKVRKRRQSYSEKKERKEKGIAKE